MKNIFWALCIITFSAFTACGGGSTEDETTSTETFNSTAPASTVIDTTKSVWTDVKPTNPQTFPSASQSANPSTTVAALNPEHGKPGHRCDIAVGAPLNSPPQQVQQTFPSAQQPLPATATQGSARLNPPHGQPGHDCAVPVGQPLKGS